jgi:hypothetical protein
LCRRAERRDKKGFFEEVVEKLRADIRAMKEDNSKVVEALFNLKAQLVATTHLQYVSIEVPVVIEVGKHGKQGGTINEAKQSYEHVPQKTSKLGEMADEQEGENIVMGTSNERRGTPVMRSTCRRRAASSNSIQAECGAKPPKHMTEDKVDSEGAFIEMAEENGHIIEMTDKKADEKKNEEKGEDSDDEVTQPHLDKMAPTVMLDSSGVPSEASDTLATLQDFKKEMERQMDLQLQRLSRKWSRQERSQGAEGENEESEESAEAEESSDESSDDAVAEVQEKNTARLRREEAETDDRLKQEKYNERQIKEGKAVKDPSHPRKPIGGAYGVFLKQNRPKIVASLPAGHKITDVTKEASKLWKALAHIQKKPYQETYEKLHGEWKGRREEG